MTGQLDLLRALGDSTRLRIVHLLRAMELAVGEIALVIGQSQPRVSRHVRILAEAGLVERRKEGSWVFLALGRSSGCRAAQIALEAMPLDTVEQSWIEADAARLAAVRAERARAAEDYFAAHAAQWDAIRSLHIPEAQVEASIKALLGDGSLGHLVDIGTGTGRMAMLFGPQARQVTALDRSPDMLRLARAKLPDDAGEHYRLLLGDFNALPLDDGGADTVILHQVLHYAQAPDHALAEAARIMAEGGRLLVADFAPHEHEELRTRDAHARLGFSDEQMAQWFAAAGLQAERTEALPGTPLTIKLWLARRVGARVRNLRSA
jgi:ubiquinone/menaquinone biosynthesis C-methylase UbiE